MLLSLFIMDEAVGADDEFNRDDEVEDEALPYESCHELLELR